MTSCDNIEQAQKNRALAFALEQIATAKALAEIAQSPRDFVLLRSALLMALDYVDRGYCLSCTQWGPQGPA